MNLRQRSTLSICIAMALSGNSFAAETSDITKNEPQTINCSDDSSKLSEAEKEKYNAQCKADDDNLFEWVAAGVAAVGAAVGIAVYNDNDGGGSHASADTGPTPPDPDPTPDPDPDPTPDPDPQPTQDYSNGVSLDPNTKTITFDAVTGQSDGPVTFAYVKSGSNYILTAPDGRTLTVTGWKVTADNQLAITGSYGSDSATWIYDRSGNFTFASADTNTFTGDGSSNTVDGDTRASGSGEAGTIVSGDDTKTDVNGDTAATDGGTGTKVDGDNAQINNNGNATVDGSGSTGTAITGDGAVVNNGGDATVSGGGTGTRVDGDDAVIVNTGDTTADGEGSAGTVINGDNASFDQKGDITVTNGATGIAVNGTTAKIDNSGTITVRDMGSTGVSVSGDNATFTNTGTIDSSLNGTGVSITGDNASVTLDGTVNVHAEKDADGVYQAATGVSVAGNNATTEITGDVKMTGASDTDATIEPESELKGVTISGNDNSVTLDGTLTMDFSASSPSGVFTAKGIDVTGSGNTVEINGGVNVSTSVDIQTEDDSHQVTGISVTGNNTVTVSGHSSLDLAGLSGAPTIFASVNEGGQVILTEDSVLDTSFTNLRVTASGDYALLQAAGSNSSIVNDGIINTDLGMVTMRADQGASVSNAGTINIDAVDSDIRRTAAMQANGTGSNAANNDGGIINIASTLTPFAPGSYAVDYPVASYSNNEYALLASNYGSVENDAGATINLNGAGLYGVAAAKGTATNAGTINVDGFIPTLDEEGTVTGKSFWQDSNALYTMSAGVVVGSTRTNTGNATGLNTGTINVNNEGFGMLALDGGTVTNQGTINLTADEGVTASADNQLIAMGVMNGGTAINDEIGVININADYGQAFYNDGTGTIVNYGKICVDDNCQDAATYNPTDSAVSVELTDGSVLALAGETTTLTNDVLIEGDVSNAGTVTGQKIVLNEADSLLTNQTEAVIDSALFIYDGQFSNSGTVNGTLTQNGGAVNNSGTLNGITTLNNGTFTNTGTMAYGARLFNDMVVYNDGDVILGNSSNPKDEAKLEMKGNSWFINNGTLTGDNNKNTIHLNNTTGGLVNNGTMNVTASDYAGAVNYWGGSSSFINTGTVNVSGVKNVVDSNGDADATTHAFFWNESTGTVNYDRDNSSAVDFTGANYVAQNDGTMNISGNNAVGMNGSANTQLVNNGTINLGTQGTTDTGLIGMQLDANATADAVIENNGTINIYASDSYAFANAGAGHVVNNGTVYIDDTVTGSGLISPDSASTTVEGLNGNDGSGSEVHYTNYTLPTQPSNSLNGYVVGTNADGSAGQLMVSNASMDGVSVNTGFTSGTAATSMTFDNVVQGSNLTDADAITSTTVVWNAKGSTDAQGNVDVTMTKNAYADVATDGSVSSVATALDAGYTNNELYSSLNVGSTAELNSALKQVSGNQATSVFREAHMLSNRFDMLADAAPQVSNGLAFNVVAKGDPRAELGKNTDYDMLALRQKLDLTGSQTLAMEYGIARLDGSGSSLAGDNGITGGYSQFFGLKHQMAFENGLSWNNALRYDVHNLDSNRSVSYGDTSKTADSSARQQYLEFRSEGAKTFELSEALTVTPYAGVKLRHTLEDGYQERNAGDFNLNMNSGSETAVDSIVGMKLDYAGKNGWGASATLEGGPNLSYAKSQRSATLAGAGSQRFAIDDGQTGGGVNSLATVGVKYSGESSALQLDAFHWKEDGISDKGMMLNFKKTF